MDESRTAFHIWWGYMRKVVAFGVATILALSLMIFVPDIGEAHSFSGHPHTNANWVYSSTGFWDRIYLGRVYPAGWLHEDWYKYRRSGCPWCSTHIDSKRVPR